MSYYTHSNTVFSYCRDNQLADAVVFDDKGCSSSNESFDELENEPQPGSFKKATKKTAVVRQRWDTIEVEEIHRYFKSYLDGGITPGQLDVRVAQEKNKKAGGKIWKRSIDKIVKQEGPKGPKSLT